MALYSVEGAASELDLTALVETYSGLLFRVAYSLLRSRTEAEDVVQDVFVRILKRTPDLLTIRDLRVWLIRVTWNLSLDRRRRIRPEQMPSPSKAGVLWKGQRKFFERILILPVCLNRKDLWLRSRDADWHCIPWRALTRSSTSPPS